ncbi:MAG: HypC/HybG/HupF family hydrogenase formation chaperone [Bacteroidetes bacterium]|nr:HypC/HybG/HupF family hydrogenase formation chaperone [Bacteroidota bacterium]
MCLALPGKVIEIIEDQEPRMGRVDFGGVKKEVCLDLVPEVRVGQYVIVHVGFAISIVNEREAEETLRLIAEIQKTSDSQGKSE